MWWWCWESWAAVTSHTRISFPAQKKKGVCVCVCVLCISVQICRERERRAQQVWLRFCNPVLSHSVIILSSLCHTYINNSTHTHTHMNTHTLVKFAQFVSAFSFHTLPHQWSSAAQGISSTLWFICCQCICFLQPDRMHSVCVCVCVCDLQWHSSSTVILVSVCSCFHAWRIRFQHSLFYSAGLMHFTLFSRFSLACVCVCVWIKSDLFLLHF